MKAVLDTIEGSKTTEAKRLFVLFMTLLTLGAGQVFSQNLKKLDVHQLTDSFYVFTSYRIIKGKRFPANGLYLITKNGAVIIDPPWDTTQAKPLADRISDRHGSQIIMVISTHYHNDRTAGLNFYKKKKIRTYSSKATYDLCEIHNEEQPEHYFDQDTSFAIGNHKFETFFPGEGHTKDNILLWFEKHKILYAGCFVKSLETQSIGNIQDANLDKWPGSIERVQRKYPSPNYIIPGHFDWTGTEQLLHTLELLKRNEDRN